MRRIFRWTGLALGLLVGGLVCSLVIGGGLLWLDYKQLPAYWQARARQPGDITLVALGDSAAQGLGASQPETSYVGKLAERVGQTTGRSVRVVNLSRSGATIADVRREQLPQLARLRADIVTLDAGANDVVHKHVADPAFAADYQAVLQAMPAGRTVVADVPYFGGRYRDDQTVRQANQIINRLAGQQQLPVAPLYDRLKARQSPLIYASDLFHPNDRGYAIWADAYWLRLQPIAERLKR